MMLMFYISHGKYPESRFSFPLAAKLENGAAFAAAQ
jgi:hypothetical protein